jgi:hypothetical protein
MIKSKFILIAFVTAFIASATLSSCKTHERCPAYGKVVKEVPTQKSV